jgi:hypothetical protein
MDDSPNIPRAQASVDHEKPSPAMEGEAAVEIRAASFSAHGNEIPIGVRAMSAGAETMARRWKAGRGAPLGASAEQDIANCKPLHGVLI